VRGIVKGVRDARARFGSTLEPFSLTEILFYKRKRGGDLHLVTQVELVDDFPKVRQDLERLGTASYCLELLSELVEPEQPEPAIFELLKDTLIFLSSGSSAKRAARIFEVKLLDVLGLMPEIKNCVMCHAPAQDPIYFNATIGGVHCKDCAVKNKGILSASSQPVSKGTLLFLQHAQRSSVKDMVQVKVVQEVGEELEKLLRRFTDYHLSHKLKSLGFMEKIGF
jgi:DNA repair protein RecO (recombination protein O)